MSVIEPVGIKGAYRQSAENVLKGMYDRKRRESELELSGLNVLLCSIPWDKLTKEEEAALWHLFISRRW